MAEKPYLSDFTIDARGACVTVRGVRLSPACLTNGEVDHHIASLKADLDAVGAEVKRAIPRQLAQNPFF